MAYRRLGDYIKEVNVRNNDLEITNPMGINIDKYFMPSVANVIGTDLSTYKLVSKNQFACNLMHVGRDERIPMALHTEDTPIIVSPAYFVFEVIQKDILLPEYLMIWFRRPEFDRNAWFYTDADVRGGLSKEAFLDMSLPIPSIEEQRKIVAEYQAVEQRIENNNRLIKALEDTAQAIYHHTFVENIDPENLPEGWRMGKLSDICIIMYGKAHQGIPNGEIPIYGSGGLMRRGNKALYNEESVLVPRKGSLNNIMYVAHPFWTVDTMFFTKPKIKNSVKYLYYFLRQFDFLAMNIGSAVPSMTTNYLNQIDILIPPSEILDYFDNKLSVIHSNISSYQKENSVILKTKNLLLAKLS